MATNPAVAVNAEQTGDDLLPLSIAMMLVRPGVLTTRKTLMSMALRGDVVIRFIDGRYYVSRESIAAYRARAERTVSGGIRS